jgi:NAD(P)-dependent dehydrogenase (short-subunit alcohol dehydrogenase family)
MAEIRFDGRVAIVTGAGQGIGRIYALELATRGARVVVNDLGGARDGAGADPSAADRVVSEIKAAGGEAVANYDSVATMQGGANIVQTAVDAFGKVDILVNNAGILRDKSFLKMSEEEWDMVIAVHLKGAFSVTQPAVKLMKAANYGRVIFTSSTSGLYGNFGQTNYGAAKMGLVGLMNTLKLETANYNIKVNTIAPTAYSRMTSDIFPPDFENKLDPQFNSPMVLYLASEANPVSGMTFVMGAGWYGRTAVVCGTGVCLGDGVRPIAPEEIADHFDRITDLEETRPHDSGAHIFEYMAPLLGR